MKPISSDDTQGDGPTISGTPIFRPGLPTLDVEEFRDFMDKLDATEEEKIEYLQLLWKIAITFVDISFGIDSTQRVVPSAREIDSPQESHLVQINSYPKQFKRAATDDAARKDKS